MTKLPFDVKKVPIVHNNSRDKGIVGIVLRSTKGPAPINTP